MSFLDQMKLPGLIDLSLILILASNTRGQTWEIHVPRRINTTLGSDVTIECNFTYPTEQYTDKVQVYWKNLEKSSFDTKDNDQRAFVFHPNTTFVLERYRGKTKLIGNINKGDCSLNIQKIMDNETSIYVRVIGKDDKYSFTNNIVSISVPGGQQVTRKLNITDNPLPTSETRTNDMKENSTLTYTTIFVPVAALLIIIFVVGIVFCIKHKRSKSFTREDSGYYANFSRASSNQANREPPCKKQDNKKLPKTKAIVEPVSLKAIDEPVYINLEAPPDRMDHSMDHTDDIYANVDYSK